MAESVILEEVASACRKAMLAGMPILYIKTDSPMFIQDLVMRKKKPLVVLISNGGKGFKGTKTGRPIYKLEDPEDQTPNYISNYSFDGKIEYKNERTIEIKKGLPDAEYNECKLGPAIWTHQMSSDPLASDRDYTADMQILEKFIADREHNYTHPMYDRLQNSVVILYSLNPRVSPMLQPYTEIIDVPLPNESQIREFIKSAAKGLPSQAEDILNRLCANFKGFSEEEIRITLNQIMSICDLDEANEENLQDEMLEIIRNRKRQKMEGGMLELVRQKDQIGGMERYRNWLKDQMEPLTNTTKYRRCIGTTPPKGVLLCGIPGCGKSAAAKFTAQELNLELLRMDVGSLMDRFQGVSEQKMRDALKLAETMSPCVLWIDELEKGFSSATDSGDNDSFKRMFAYMLGWMQDNKDPCFIFATANDLGALPKEFFRSGRFDALFAVYLPTAQECADILEVCMRKKRDDAAAAQDEEDAKELFEEACYSKDFLRQFINENLTASHKGAPRIVVGSDLELIVTIALRNILKARRGQLEAPITQAEWKSALENVLREKTLVTYGQGEENIDAIAVAYCRMLRKGFIPTTEHPLFDSADYHVDRLEKYEALLRRKYEAEMSGAPMKESERQDLEKDLAAAEIMAYSDSEKSLTDDYDRAVYCFLRERINRVAVKVEESERNKLYRG